MATWASAMSTWVSRLLRKCTKEPANKQQPQSEESSSCMRNGKRRSSSQQHVIIRCSSVTLGQTRRVLPTNNDQVRFDAETIDFQWPLDPNEDTEEEVMGMRVRLEDVQRAELHLGRGLPLIALEVRRPISKKIKLKERKDDEEEKCGRVVFTPISLSGNGKRILKSLFSATNTSEVDAARANEMIDEDGDNDDDKEEDDDNERVVCEFPVNLKSSHKVTLKDYKCLAGQTYLNDVVIDFYLRYLQYTLLHDCRNVHIFSSFFYSKLLQCTDAQMESNAYERLRRWTRRVDVFDKDFIVVPVNEQSHWMVAIICYPGHVSTTKNKGDSERVPYILVLDSLSTGSEKAIARTLRQFLEFEFKATRDEEKRIKSPKENDEKKLFTSKTIQMLCPPVPQQENVFDCGLFVLHYIETFFQDPKIPFEDLLSSMTPSWFSLEEVHCKRRRVAALIRQLALNQDSRRRNLPLLQFDDPQLQNGFDFCINNNSFNSDEHDANDEEDFEPSPQAKRRRLVEKEGDDEKGRRRKRTRKIGQQQ